MTLVQKKCHRNRFPLHLKRYRYCAAGIRLQENAQKANPPPPPLLPSALQQLHHQSHPCTAMATSWIIQKVPEIRSSSRLEDQFLGGHEWMMVLFSKIARGYFLQFPAYRVNFLWSLYPELALSIDQKVSGRILETFLSGTYLHICTFAHTVSTSCGDPFGAKV